MNPDQAVQKLREVIRRKHFSLSTETTYAAWLRRFMRYIEKCPAGWPSEVKLEKFLTALARDEVAASTQNQAFNALVFFYQECLGRLLQGINSLRAKRGSVIRRAPAVDEVAALLREVQDEGHYPVRLVVLLLYGCGLRVTEPLGLRIRDVDLAGSRFIIRQAKGRKDRVVAIPCSLGRQIEAQIEAARVIWLRDVAAQVPIKLPSRMDKKYPYAKASWQWAWLFPQNAPCRDPRSGQIVRWHQLESSVQRAVRSACRRLNLQVLPHELRHAYATHCLYAQQMGYLHAEALSVRSPLDQGLVGS